MDRATRKKVLSKIPYGLFILGSRDNSAEGVMMIANWISQVSFDPPLLVVSIEEDSDMCSYIETSKYFSVNMLASGNKEIAKAFLKKFKGKKNLQTSFEMSVGKGGMPFLNNAVASLECKVVQSMKAGDHVIFLGEIVDGMDRGDEEILTLKETGWKYSR